MPSSTPHLPTQPIHILKTHTGPINALAFSSLGGTYILTGSSDRQIHLSRTEPASNTTKTSTGPPASVTTTTTPIQKYTSHGYPVLSISVARDNNTFASASGDRTGPFLWDIQRPDTTLRRCGGNTNQGHTSRITCVSFASESDSVLVSGSDDRSVRIWDLKSRDSRPLQILEEAKDGVSCLVCPQGTYEIVAGSVDGRVRAYDVRMGSLVTDVQAGAVTSLDVTRDGKAMLVGCLDGRIRLMDRDNGQCLRAFPSGEDTSADPKAEYQNDSLRLQSCLGANEALVLSGSESDGRVRAWNVLSGKVVGNVPVSDTNKIISVVQWRDGSASHGRQAVWAAGATDGIVKIYGG